MKKRNRCSLLFSCLLVCLFLAVAGTGVSGAFAAAADDVAAAEEMAAEARRLAQEGRLAGDVDKVAQALSLAEEASTALQALAADAMANGNTALGSRAMAAIDEVDQSFSQIIEAAVAIGATSTDPAAVAAAGRVAQRAETAQNAIGAARTQLANAFPGQPGEPEAFEPIERPNFGTPLRDSLPPIDDTPAASPT